MWLRLDDQFPDHPKVSPLTDEAFRLHIGALCYAARFLTDGHIARSQAGRIAGRDPGPLIEELLAAELWEEAAGGYQLHDFLDYNPSRAQVEAERARRKAAAAVGGRARASQGTRASDGRYASDDSSDIAGQTAGRIAGSPAGTSHQPRPVPSPSPSSSPVPRAASDGAGHDAGASSPTSVRLDGQPQRLADLIGPVEELLGPRNGRAASSSPSEEAGASRTSEPSEEEATALQHEAVDMTQRGARP